MSVAYAEPAVEPDEWTPVELTTEESHDRAQYEAMIDRGERSFVQAGQGLTFMRDSRNGRLYRATHSTFEEYCRGRWEMSASRARQLCLASQTVSNLESVTTVTPRNERQVRPLMGLDPEQQREAWLRVLEETDGCPTGPAVEDVVREMKGEPVSLVEDSLPTLEESMTRLCRLLFEVYEGWPPQHVEAMGHQLVSLGEELLERGELRP